MNEEWASRLNDLGIKPGTWYQPRRVPGTHLTLQVIEPFEDGESGGEHVTHHCDLQEGDAIVFLSLSLDEGTGDDRPLWVEGCVRVQAVIDDVVGYNGA